jgi:hypothetical protein
MNLTILIAWDAEMLERGANVVTTMTPLEWMEEQVTAESSSGDYTSSGS